MHQPEYHKDVRETKHWGKSFESRRSQTNIGVLRQLADHRMSLWYLPVDSK